MNDTPSTDAFNSHIAIPTVDSLSRLPTPLATALQVGCDNVAAQERA